MTRETWRHDVATKRVVYQISGVDGVSIRRDVEYRVTDTGALTCDIYSPPDSTSEAPIPAVVLVAGYPDIGVEARIGCKFKEMGSSVSWGQLIAASGLMAITYTNREPEADLHELLHYVRGNASALGIDENRIGVWASSGNVPLAVSLLMRDARESLKCAEHAKAEHGIEEIPEELHDKVVAAIKDVD